MQQTSADRLPPTGRYYVRRDLSTRELVPAISIALGTAVTAFYIARIMLQRAPLGTGGRVRAEDQGAAHGGRASARRR